MHYTKQYLPAQDGNIDNFYNILKYDQNVRQFIRLDFSLIFFMLGYCYTLVMYTGYVSELYVDKQIVSSLQLRLLLLIGRLEVSVAQVSSL